MKVMWITNIPVGGMAEHLKTKNGVWMDALLNQLINYHDLQFIIVTTWNVQSIEHIKKDGVEYYLLPGGNASNYKRKESLATKDWDKVISETQPSVIHVWGTEYPHAIPALKVANQLNIPSLIYIQGIMKAIARWADGCVNASTMLRYTTMRDIYRGQLWAFQNRWFEKRSETEEKLISLSGSVVVENNWAELFCKSINPKLNIFRIPLNINEVFYKHEWAIEKVKRHSILCNASGPSYKGIHYLIMALTIVAKRYPDVKLYIPGRSMIIGNGFFEKQKMPGYYSYITNIIKKNGLINNVEFTGYLEQEELAQRLSKTHVFVLASSIENHSSSLKEAMAVGTPAIASQVGGIPEYFEYGKCGFSYRYQEYECLAGYICMMFENDDLCQEFSRSSRIIANSTSNKSINGKIISMYRELGGKEDR